MAAGAAHEINNPLAIISGRAQQLAMDEKDPARRETLQAIVHQAGRASDIIGELREFASPARPEWQVVDPVALAEGVAADLRERIRKPVANLQVEAAADCPAIRVDPEQVADALGEVVQNAIDACTQEQAITLSVQVPAGRQAVRFVVADKGPGMSAKTRQRALDPFYSGREAGRRRGLGLPRAYRTVQANGGQMALESVPGQGTTVRMTFRAFAGEEPGETPMGKDATINPKGVET